MMTRDEFRQIAANGTWKQNSSLIQLLGLCPLLAVTTNLVNGVMLSLATIIVMSIAGLAVASLRNLIPHEVRIPVFILIVAALVTVVDLLFNAGLHELYLVLGIFIPLIVTNCIVLARVEAFANKNPPLQSMFDGIFMGVGMLWTLALLGGLRELIGNGTLFSGIDMVFPGLHASVRRQSGTHHRTGIRHDFSASCLGHSFGPSHRQKRQSRNTASLCRCPDTAGHPRAR